MEHSSWNALEYTQIKEMIKNLTVTSLGKEEIEKVEPSANFHQVEHQLQITAEAMDFLRLRGEVSLYGLEDIRNALKRVTKGSILQIEECWDIATTIHAGRQIKSSMRQLPEENVPLTYLRKNCEQIASLDELEEEIKRCIGEDLDVKSAASVELRSIRQKLVSGRQRIQETLHQMLRSTRIQKMLQESLITIRNDRYVIPIKAEYRGSLAGIVHDQSASGATLYVEPASVVALNNQLRTWELDESREIDKILSALSDLVAEVTNELTQNIAILGELDGLFAKAEFARIQRAMVPKLTNKGPLVLKQARHPLLARETAVPIDLMLGKDTQAIIITGPNTGGKTVTLKTVGLLALMTQSGFPIPVLEGTVMPVFSGIFADIGDEQSIEQSLSTFSSHMTKIIRILDKIDHRGLVLFDELGAGTDPTEGAAMAVAILNHVLKKGCSIVATTHYSELKVFAHTHPNAVNASVQFDVETLRPTYKLEVGVPGESNAFSIAKRLGLSDAIIEAAKEEISQEESRLEEVITSLAKAKREAEEEGTRALHLREEAEKLYQDVRGKWQHWEEEKHQLHEKARQEARSIVNKATREAEEVLTELRAWAKERPQDIKEHKLTEARSKLEQANPGVTLVAPVETFAPETELLSVGDEVKAKSFGQKGTVVEILTDNQYRVQVGSLKLVLNRTGLTKLKSTVSTTKPITSVRSRSFVKSEIDLRGKLVEEALLDIEKYLDDAILAGFKQIHLIHGKGTGALRKGVHTYLAKHRRVASYRNGEYSEGGLGVTVVELK
ncbi:endonuclease MutS2 [Shimazuella kribbensis]|uniref:endonuclease MutS2 n=1 Tax=Shimazuella kribbensis TaxID=139808 RepID=UPI00041F7E1C|nr:endonuclease MutS2 [Shimazuella kribbensis]